jgi:HEXXH motif-containing protein
VLVDSDLEKSWHPEFRGKIYGLNKHEDVIKGSNAISEALRVISFSSRAFHLVTANCSAAALVRSSGTMEAGKCISLSSKAVPGLIYLSETSALLTAESIVHESTHQALQAIADVSPLVVPGGGFVDTPLRPDPRPIEGLLHQASVLKILSAYYADVVDVEDPLIGQNRQKIRRRYEAVENDFKASLSILDKYLGQLTPVGKKILENLSTRSFGGYLYAN